MERVFGAELQSVSALHLAQTEGACGLESMLIKQLWSHAKSLQATSYQGFTPVVLTAGPFASFTIWSTGVSLPRCGKLKKYKRCLEKPQWTTHFFILFLPKFGENCAPDGFVMCMFISPLPQVYYLYKCYISYSILWANMLSV